MFLIFPIRLKKEFPSASIYFLPLEIMAVRALAIISALKVSKY